MNNSKSVSQRGLSGVESLLALVVSALLAAQALPAMQQLKQRKAVELRAQALMTDLKQARSESVMAAAQYHIRFRQMPGGSCYVLHSGRPNDCSCDESGQAMCIGEAQVLRHEWLPSSTRITIRANVGTMSFNARQGAVTSTGSIDITEASGLGIRHIVSIAGRVRSCALSSGIGNLPACA
ncbi:GspH/FimT family protein [Paucibacter sp. DJ2R-2]|uniref:GspH/FimT family protein n=1 Tax=Paucibacter sp. DJ2R-2 TaxID=2893558 RepID=UPI0021E3EE42|nr:GspH/FimT family protein [Paucibacter sp. DJ2R-2]MCV2422965.1 GspH/FimT family protein [Paucibacter sp. DJ4R-1]MCV2440861.1 GspH/FimT family protein [Paucibacter sp. DJ2R-2]